MVIDCTQLLHALKYGQIQISIAVPGLPAMADDYTCLFGRVHQQSLLAGGASGTGLFDAGWTAASTDPQLNFFRHEPTEGWRRSSTGTGIPS